MASQAEVLKRNRYFIEGAPDLPHSSRNHVDDWHEHHLPLARMHQAHLHDWGIASGLEVRVPPEGQQLEVQPGVAVDSTGELIALSADGQADISVLAPGEPGRQIAAPFRLGTEGHASQLCYLTIQFVETLRLTQGVGGKLEQTPWLRLQPTAGEGAFVDDGSSIILAVVEIDAAGGATVHEQQAAVPHARRLMGSATAELRLRRAATTAGQVGQGLAAALSAEPGGGLRVTVPEATDGVHFSRGGGDVFTTFAVHATATQMHGSLSVQGDHHTQGSLRVEGSTNLGGDVRAAGSLRVTGDTNVDANLSVTGTAALGGNAQVQGNLQVSGFIDAPEVRQNGARLVNSPWNPIDGGIDFAGGKVGINTVGIGTANPGAKLEIRGSGDPLLLINHAGASGNPAMWFQQDGATKAFLWWDQTNNRLNLGTPTTNPIVSLQDNGNVGIGTTTPKAKLHVAADIVAGSDVNGQKFIFHTRTNGGGDFLHITGDDVNGNWQWNKGISFIRATGNVGIGTTNPVRALQIGPSIDAAFTFEPADASPNAGYIRFGDNTGWKLHFGRSRENSIVTGVPLNTGTTGVLMTLQDNGNVGIGTTQPRFTLEVNGSAGKPGGGMWTSTSDLRLKRNVKTLPGALKKLLKLRGVSYRWQEPEQHGNLTGEQMGFVAQEVEEVFPEWVSTNTAGFKDLTIRGLEALVVEAFRELNNKIEALELKREA